jgi:hypothetical protein
MLSPAAVGADDRLPEGAHYEQVGDSEEGLSDAVQVVHVGQDLVVLYLGCGHSKSGGSAAVRQAAAI